MYVVESSWSTAFASSGQPTHESTDFPSWQSDADVLHMKHLAPPFAVPVQVASLAKVFPTNLASNHSVGFQVAAVQVYVSHVLAVQVPVQSVSLKSVLPVLVHVTAWSDARKTNVCHENHNDAAQKIKVCNANVPLQLPVTVHSALVA